MAIRCKMRYVGIQKDEDGYEGAKFQCEYDSQLCEEDRAFQTATPWGIAFFGIDNPKAIDQLEEGKYYYFDIFAVEPPMPEG